MEALDRSFPDWRVYVSSRLTDSEYDVGQAFERLQGRARVTVASDLHLATSMRSFRSEKVSRLVKEILDLEMAQARETLRGVRDRYPMALTRDLSAARRWLRARAPGLRTLRHRGVVAGRTLEAPRP